MIRARVIGTGSYLPPKIVTNHDLEKLVDTNDEWIRQRSGIEERRMAEPGVGSADLGIEAARQAMDAAGVKPEELDLIICATTTPDHVFPSSACLIQGMLGAKTAGAFDVNAACSGFVYALATVRAYIESGLYKNVLLVATELVNNRLNWKARDTAVLFGDGAAAVMFRGEEGDRGILTSYLRSDGAMGDILILPAGGSKIPITAENAGGPESTIQMRGPELFKHAVVQFGDAIARALTDSGLALEEIDLFIPHQANMRILQLAAERAGFPEEKVVFNIQKTGNTVAASIPLALHQAVLDGRVKDGDHILFASFGAGLTWASSVLKW